MKKILIVYDSEAGATREASEIIAGVFPSGSVEMFSVADAGRENLTGFDCIIMGSPVLYGKMSGGLRKFIKNNSAAIGSVPVYCFFTCMRLTRCYEAIPHMDCYADPSFDEPLKSFKDMNSMEKSHSLQYYLKNILSLGGEFNPEKVAFFRGNLDFGRLKFFSRMVMRFMAAIQEQVNEGEFLDRGAIEEWARGIFEKIVLLPQMREQEKEKHQEIKEA